MAMAINKHLQVHLAGVGGQGVVSIGRLLVELGQYYGFKIKGNETHGMSQRGGSVVFQVRIGNFSGVMIPEGEADVLLATEPMEALRSINMLKKEGIIISDTHQIVPPIANIIHKPYPDMEIIVETLKRKTINVYLIPATRIANELGHSKGANLVLLGQFIRVTDFFEIKTVEKLIEKKWPKFKEKNLEAFRTGHEFMT